MNISRNFLLIGAIYLIIGISFGTYMSAAQTYEFAPLHAHINLLGFVLMSIFGILYRLIPAMAENMLGKVHFWLHQIGALILLVMLFLLLGGRITEAGMVPLAPIAEIAILAGIVCYAVNLYRTNV